MSSGHILVYRCTTCGRAWENKETFHEHGNKRGHKKCAVIKVPTDKWEELKQQFPSEDEI